MCSCGVVTPLFQRQCVVHSQIHFCILWLYEVIWVTVGFSFNQPGNSSLTSAINKELLLSAHWITLDVFIFQTILCKNPGDIYVWKSHLISTFWNTHASSSGTKNHAMFKVTQITFFPVLMLRLNLSQLPSPCLGVWMHWVTAMWLADLDVCVNEQMNRCTCSSVVLCNLNI